MSFFDLFRKKTSTIHDQPQEDNSQIIAEARRLVKNAIQLNPQADAATLPHSTKIGGKPYLPTDFAWPVFTNPEDGVTRPLSFLCQINLAEVTAYDLDHVLPEEGLLSFFYDCEAFCWGFDPAEKDAIRVYYFEDTTGFLPHDIPADLAEEYAMPQIPLTFAAEPCCPNYEELEIHSDLDCDWENYDRELTKLGLDKEGDPEGHKLLGYADIIQNEMLTDCERVSRGIIIDSQYIHRGLQQEDKQDIRQKAKDWVLLLELGTIETDDFEWMFGDCGMLYYYIRKEDLAAKRFDKLWFSLQCG